MPCGPPSTGTGTEDQSYLLTRTPNFHQLDADLQAQGFARTWIQSFTPTDNIERFQATWTRPQYETSSTVRLRGPIHDGTSAPVRGQANSKFAPRNRAA